MIGNNDRVTHQVTVRLLGAAGHLTPAYDPDNPTDFQESIMKRTIRLLAAPAAAVLLLAACSSGSDQPAEAPPAADSTSNEIEGEGEEAEGDAIDDGENIVYEQGTFTASNDTGAEFTIEIPAESPADIEEFREAVGQDPVGYIKIDIDNTNGTEDAGPSDVHLVDEDGNEYSYESAFIQIGDWGPDMRDDGPEDENDGYWYALPDGTELSEDEYDELNSQGTDLYNDHLDSDALPHAETTAYFIGPEVPEALLYVEVQEAMIGYIAEPAA